MLALRAPFSSCHPAIARCLETPPRHTYKRARARVYEHTHIQKKKKKKQRDAIKRSGSDRSVKFERAVCRVCLWCECGTAHAAGSLRCGAVLPPGSLFFVFFVVLRAGFRSRRVCSSHDTKPADLRVGASERGDCCCCCFALAGRLGLGVYEMEKDNKKTQNKQR